ncbi:recombination regulator RecX [Nonomuraea antimicrobica]
MIRFRTQHPSRSTPTRGSVRGTIEPCGSAPRKTGRRHSAQTRVVLRTRGPRLRRPGQRCPGLSPSRPRRLRLRFPRPRRLRPGHLRPGHLRLGRLRSRHLRPGRSRRRPRPGRLGGGPARGARGGGPVRGARRRWAKLLRIFPWAWRREAVKVGRRRERSWWCGRSASCGGADGGRPVEGDHDSLEAQQSVSRERRPSDEWHSEVLAGSSWFAAEPDDGGQQPRSGKGRRSGGSGKRARRSGGKSVRSEEPDSETRPSDRRSGRYDTETSPYGEGVEQHDTGASSYLEGVERHDAGASPYTEGVERHDAGASSYTEEAGWGGAETRSYGETGEGFGDQAGRRGRGAGRFGGGGRKGSRKRGRWPDGPDAESSAGSAPDADPESVARAICLRLLTIAPKTRAQLAEALRKREVPEEAAEAVLSRFSELGLINDEAFAAAWVDSRHHGRGLAKRALAAELRHRGVDGDLVNEAVERLDPDQEEETARRLVERKVSGTRSLDPQTRTRRLAGMLARKGYPSGLAFRVIREALEQEGIEMEDDGFL